MLIMVDKDGSKAWQERLHETVREVMTKGLSGRARAGRRVTKSASSSMFHEWANELFIVADDSGRCDPEDLRRGFEEIGESLKEK